MTALRKPRVGLALGSGSARGWAHIGVIRALEEAGVRPDLVCGTSIGALVGAAYAAGELERLERWVLGLEIGAVVGFADLSLSAGLLKGDRLMQFFRRNFTDRPIDQLAVPFAAVATSLQTGAEVWLQSGSTLDAVRSSIALPGIFTPVRREGTLLVDGGLANPIPVYCDASIRDFDLVYPAAGSLNSSVEVTPERLFDLVGDRWIDLCRLPE